MADLPSLVAVWIYIDGDDGESETKIVALDDLPQTLHFGPVQVVLEDAGEA